MRDKIYLTPDEIDNPKCERECQETAVHWLRNDSIVTVSSSDPSFITKMKRRMKKAPELYTCYTYANNKDPKSGKYYSYFFEFDKKLLSFRTSIATNRKPMSEEARKASAERFRKMWEEKRLAGEINEDEDLSLEELMEEFEDDDDE